MIFYKSHSRTDDSSFRSKLQVRMTTLYAVILLDSMSISVLIPILEPVLLDEQAHILLEGFSNELRSFAYGALMSVPSLIVFYVAPVLATISDHIGRRKVLIVTTSGLIAANLFSGLSIATESFALLVVGRVIAGFTAANQPVSQAALVDMVSTNRRAFHITMSLLAISLGFVLGPLLALVFIDLTSDAKFEEEMPFLILSAGALLVVLLLWRYFVDERQAEGKWELRSINFNQGVNCFKRAASMPTVLGILLLFLTMQIGWATYFLFSPDFLTKQFSFDRTSITLFVACLGLGFCIANGLFQPILIKFIRFKVLAVLGLTATAVILCFTLFSNKPYEQYVLAVMLGTVASVAYASIVTMLSKSVCDEDQGWIFGMVGATVSLSWAIASFTGGILESLGPIVPLVTSIVLVAAAAVGMVRASDPVSYG